MRALWRKLDCWITEGTEGTVNTEERRNGGRTENSEYKIISVRPSFLRCSVFPVRFVHSVHSNTRGAPMIKGIKFASIPVTDQDRSLVGTP